MALLDGGARLGPQEPPAAIAKLRWVRAGGDDDGAEAIVKLRRLTERFVLEWQDRRFANPVPLHKMNTKDICVRLREAGLREATGLVMERRITGRDVYELSPDALLQRLGPLAASGLRPRLGAAFRAIQALAGVIWLDGSDARHRSVTSAVLAGFLLFRGGERGWGRCSCSATPPTPSRSTHAPRRPVGARAAGPRRRAPTLGPFEHHGGALFARGRVSTSSPTTVEEAEAWCATLVDADGRPAGGFRIDSPGATPRRGDGRRYPCEFYAAGPLVEGHPDWHAFVRPLVHASEAAPGPQLDPQFVLGVLAAYILPTDAAEYDAARPPARRQRLPGCCA